MLLRSRPFLLRNRQQQKMANRGRENSVLRESEALVEGRRDRRDRRERLSPSQPDNHHPGQLSSRSRSQRLLRRLLPLVCHLKKESSCFNRSSAVSDRPITLRNRHALRKRDRQETIMVVSASLGWMTFKRPWIPAESPPARTGMRRSISPACPGASMVCVSSSPAS